MFGQHTYLKIAKESEPLLLNLVSLYFSFAFFFLSVCLLYYFSVSQSIISIVNSYFLLKFGVILKVIKEMMSSEPKSECSFIFSVKARITMILNRV